MSSIAITKKTYLEWYKSMLLMRKFEEKAGQLYGQQKIRGFCHLYIGQEAVVAGAMSVLRPADSMNTAYCCHAHAIAKGVTPDAVMAELFGTRSDEQTFALPSLMRISNAVFSST